MLLFLRGNWQLLGEMVEEHNATVVLARKEERERVRKERVAKDASEAVASQHKRQRVGTAAPPAADAAAGADVPAPPAAPA